MDCKNIKITCGALITASVILLLFDNLSLMAALFAVTFHELGHILALRVMSIPIKGAEVSSFGLNITYDGKYVPYIKDIIAAAAGPAFNFAAVFITAIANKSSDSDISSVIIAFNAALCMFNLLPISILDGGKILYCAAAVLFGPTAAEFAAAFADRAFTCVIFALGVMMFVKTGYNFTLLLSSFWLFYVVNKKQIL